MEQQFAGLMTFLFVLAVLFHSAESFSLSPSAEEGNYAIVKFFNFKFVRFFN